MIKSNPCKLCGSAWHTKAFCPLKPRKLIKATKRPRQQSDKEIEYQVWKETVARPLLIERDGNKCACCGRPAYDGEKLDIDHIDGKGSHPESKRDVDNMQLLDRICHHYKTVNKSCPHSFV